MNFYSAYRIGLYLLVLLSTVAYAAANEDITYLILALPFMGAAYTISGGLSAARSRPLPRWMIGVMLLVATAQMAYSWAGDVEDTIGVLSRYLVLLQIIKLFDAGHPRDRTQLIGLSVMLGIAAALTSVKLETGVALALYIPVLAATAMLHQVFIGAEHAGWTLRPGDAAGEQTAPAALGRIGVLLFAASSAVAIALFILMPRGIGANAFGAFRPPVSTVPVSRFTDSVQLGQAGFVSQSQRPVMEVRVTVSASPMYAGRPIRLRGSVLDEYDAATGRWTRSAAADERPRRMSVPEQPLAEEPAGRILVKQHISMRPEGRAGAYLFSLLTPRAFASTTFSEIATYGHGVIRAAERRMQNRSSVADSVQLLEYTVISDPYFRLPGDRRGSYAPLPKFPASIGTLARQVLEDRRVPYSGEGWNEADKTFHAAAIRDFLLTNYTYTLDLAATGEGRDPIEAFLFDLKRGNCEYFASAMAAMCLSVDIPARYVTGYLATEYDATTDVYTVRESGAHAWTEVEVLPGVWREFDATPPEDVRRAQQGGGGLAARWMRFMGSLDSAWSRLIIGYNQNQQSLVLGRSADDPGFFGRWFESWAERASRRSRTQEIAPSWQRFGLAALGLALLTAGIAVAWSGRTALWRLLRRHGRAITLRLRALVDPAARRRLRPTGLYWAALEALDRHGLGKPDHLPPLAHAEELRDRHPHASAALEVAADVYYRAQYAGYTFSTQEMNERESALMASLNELARTERGRA